MRYSRSDVEDAGYTPMTVIEATAVANGAVGVLLIAVPAELAAQRQTVVHFFVNSTSEDEGRSVSVINPK